MSGLTDMQRLAIACGNEPYADMSVCPTCNGKGMIPCGTSPASSEVSASASSSSGLPSSPLPPTTDIESLCRPATNHYHRIQLPIVAILRGLASQENNDGDESSVMLAAADLLVTLHAMATDAPEINPSNYDHADVVALNAAVIEIWEVLERAVKP